MSGVVLVLSGVATLLLIDGRETDGYEVGGAAQRLIAETGLHLATLWPASEIPMVDPDTPSADLRAAFDRGRAWSREEAVERSLALVDALAEGSPAPA